MSPADTAPPLPEAVATPPLPADAMSLPSSCAKAIDFAPRTAVTAPAKIPFPYFICPCPPLGRPFPKGRYVGREWLADECQVVVPTARISNGRAAIGRHPNVGQIGN